MPAAAPSLRDNTVNIHHFKQLGKALRSVPDLGACGRECLVKGSAQFYQVVKKDLLRAVADRDFICLCSRGDSAISKRVIAVLGQQAVNFFSGQVRASVYGVNYRAAISIGYGI